MSEKNQIEFNDEFKETISLLEETQTNVFITGKAGTGKSTLLSYFSKSTEKNPVILAPTGVAALNVKGQTIHSFFTFGIDISVEKISTKKFKPRKKDIYKKIDMIIIDEISMVRADLLDCIDIFLREYGPHKNTPFGGVQMVFIGDLYQLPPIIGRDEKEIFDKLYDTPFFFSAYALQRTNLEIIELDKIYRQKDNVFISMLNRIRNNTVNDDDIKRLKDKFTESQKHTESLDGDFSIYLTTTNKRADEINDQYLADLPGRKFYSDATISGDFSKDYYPTAVDLIYKKNAQIMMLNNDSSGKWVNGSIGIIEDEKEDKDDETYLSIKLQTSEGIYKTAQVYPYSWEVFQFVEENGQIVSKAVGTFKQYPIRLAWAVTIHKSQGKTFDKVNIDFGRGAFLPGQVYVALSRCRSLEGIKLLSVIHKNHIRTDKSIHSFITKCHYDKAQKNLPIETRIERIQKAIDTQSSITMTYLKTDNSRVTTTLHPISIGSETNDNQTFQCFRGYFKNPAQVRIFVIDRIIQLH